MSIYIKTLHILIRKTGRKNSTKQNKEKKKKINVNDNISGVLGSQQSSELCSRPLHMGVYFWHSHVHPYWLPRELSFQSQWTNDIKLAGIQQTEEKNFNESF